MGSVPAKAPFPTIHPIFANAFDSRIAGMIHRALLAVVEAKKRDLEIQVTRAEAAGITVIGKRKRGVNGTAAVSPVKIEDTGRVLDVDAIRALIPEIPQEANHIARRINAIVNGRLSDLVPMPTLGIPALEPLAVVPTTVIVSAFDRPKQNFPDMIKEILLSVAERKLTAAEIFDHIERKHPYAHLLLYGLASTYVVDVGTDSLRQLLNRGRTRFEMC